MSLNARLVAIEGIGFTPIQIAVQGLLDYIAAGGTTSSRMRATTERKLKVIRDVKHRLPHGVATAAARAPTARVIAPALPPMEVIEIAPVVVEEVLPEPVVIPVPVSVSALAPAKQARAATKAGALRGKVSVRQEVLRSHTRRPQTCALAWAITATCGVSVSLPSAFAGTRANDFDDVYASQSYEQDDEEDLLLLAVAAL